MDNNAKHDDQNHAVEEILDDLEELAKKQDHVTIGTIVERVGHRGYGPFFTVPALFELTPLGAVPGVPTALAAIIITFALQIALGRQHMWLPDIIERQSIAGHKVEKATRKMKSFGRKLDGWFHERLPIFITDTAIRVAAIAAVLLCLTVPPLELVPFASSAPMGAIAILGLAILARDGALMLAGYGAAIFAVAVSFGLIGSVGF